MPRRPTSVLPIALVILSTGVAMSQQPDLMPPARIAAAIQQAAPDRPAVAPAAPRKVLVYGRVRTHPESVPCCFKAFAVLGRKTGAFEAVLSTDPTMFLADNLKQFDAVVMNNTHERHPMLPADFDQLNPQQQKAATDREETLKQNLLDFVAGGKGIVGIHGATAGIHTWPEFLEMIGGKYGGHFSDEVWVKPEEPDHPLCAAWEGKSFPVRDEIYMFGEPYSPEKVRVLLSLDLSKTPDPKKRDDGQYAVSWVRPYGKGRVFYCSLGHVSAVYCNPVVLRHFLAGTQFAIGDLKADAQPRR